MNKTQTDTAGNKGVEVGNTDTSPVPNNKKCRNWNFTINNWTMDNKKEVLDTKCKQLVMQAEVGLERTPHLQGCISFQNARSFKSVQEMWNCNPHWSSMSKRSSWKAMYKYCTKEDTRVDGPWGINIDFPEPVKVIKELRPWQSDLIKKLDWKDDRKIRWYWEEKGGVGKTALAKYLCKHYNAIYVNGCGKDILYGVTAHINKKSTNTNKLVCIFGYARSKKQYVSYQALESLKDGIWFSPKYEGGMMNINSPEIIVFANWPPEENELSEDRWDVVCLDS